MKPSMSLKNSTRSLKPTAAASVLLGYHKEVSPKWGEYTPHQIRKVVLGEEEPAYQVPGEPIPVRPPVMCAGCPHRGVFYVLHKLKLQVSGDIGCYTLGAVAPLNSMDTTICMGASVGVAMGMAKARGNDFAKKTVSVIGDPLSSYLVSRA